MRACHHACHTHPKRQGQHTKSNQAIWRCVAMGCGLGLVLDKFPCKACLFYPCQNLIIRRIACRTKGQRLCGKVHISTLYALFFI
ncbi:hypothetical protein [Moraxella lacunata]|uniref:hypothetical protein n=1 Tax=Moraxella lacunata TaxID=477 RepID=UPI003EE2D3C7